MIDGWLVGWMDRWTDAYVDGYMHGSIDEYMGLDFSRIDGFGAQGRLRVKQLVDEWKLNGYG